MSYRIVLKDADGNSNVYDVDKVKFDLEDGGSQEFKVPVLQQLDITNNGTYTVPEGIDGYNQLSVNVEGGSTVPELPTLDKPATPDEVMKSYEYIDENGEKQTGTYDKSEELVASAELALSYAACGENVSRNGEKPNVFFEPSGKKIRIHACSSQCAYLDANIADLSSLAITGDIITDSFSRVISDEHGSIFRSRIDSWNEFIASGDEIRFYGHKCETLPELSSAMTASEIAEALKSTFTDAMKNALDKKVPYPSCYPSNSNADWAYYPYRWDSVKLIGDQIEIVKPSEYKLTQSSSQLTPYDQGFSEYTVGYSVEGESEYYENPMIFTQTGLLGMTAPGMFFGMNFIVSEEQTVNAYALATMIAQMYGMTASETLVNENVTLYNGFSGIEIEETDGVLTSITTVDVNEISAGLINMTSFYPPEDMLSDELAMSWFTSNGGVIETFQPYDIVDSFELDIMIKKI